MLTKSQAKSFFVLGTVVCAAAFVGLTVDTFQRIPNQTHSENLTTEVVRGKHLFEKNNCMGCHTILGEGAYYAPELTKVYSRRGEAFIRTLLKDPEAMYPGERKMVNYHFTEEEIGNLVQFFKWIGEIDLNGFPPKPDLMMSTANVAAGSSGVQIASNLQRPLVFNQVCLACHSLGGQGGQVGPKLDDVGERRNVEYLTQWIGNPSSIKADAKMPKLPLSEKDIAELAQFLSQQKVSK